MTAFGWDASDFDWARGPMDLAAARADGIDFFTHKATEGTSTKHVRYGEALRRARDAGIPFVGAYIVVRSGNVAAQVNYFLSYLDSQTPWWRAMPEFFLQVDLEHWPYDQVPAEQGVAACTLLRTLTGKWVVLYAPQWAYGNGIPGSDPLWASAYGGNPALPYRQAYPGDGDGKRWQAYSGRTPTFLQYGSQTVIGSQHSCDANAFRGSLAELRQMITESASLAPAPPKEDDDMTKLIAPTQGWGANSVFKVFPTSLGMALEGLSDGEELASAVKLWGQEEYVKNALAYGRPIEDIRAEWRTMLGGGGHGGGPSLDQIRKVVDEELDEQSLGGADKD